MLSLLSCLNLVKVFSEYLCNHESSCDGVSQLQQLENTLLFHGESSGELNCVGVIVLEIRGILKG